MGGPWLCALRAARRMAATVMALHDGEVGVMPKFNLYEKSTNLPGDTPGRAEVGWSTGHVQLATCSDNMDTLRALGATAAPDQPDWRGIFLQLDRDGINELIRNLRRARDSAYGRDE